METILQAQPQLSHLLDRDNDTSHDRLLHQAPREMEEDVNCETWARKAEKLQKRGHGGLAMSLFRAVVEETLPNLERYGASYMPVLQRAGAGLMALTDAGFGNRKSTLETLFRLFEGAVTSVGWALADGLLKWLPHLTLHESALWLASGRGHL